jgi:alpha-tubulin suppressor-like RCC1 family protein
MTPIVSHDLAPIWNSKKNYSAIEMATVCLFGEVGLIKNANIDLYHNNSQNNEINVQIKNESLKKYSSPKKNIKDVNPLLKYLKIVEQNQTPIFNPPQSISLSNIGQFSPYMILKISCIYKHILILMNNGDLYSFGEGDYGKLGNGETISSEYLLKILSNVTDIATGLNHSAAISRGKLFTWGCGECGQTGHGSFSNVYTPKLVEYFARKGITPIKVACGEKHTLVLADNGLVYGFGLAMFGQLGILSHTKYPEWNSQLMFQWKPKVLSAYKRIRETSIDFKRLKVRRDFFKTTNIACGQNFSVLLNHEGKVYFCGENLTGIGAQGDTKGRMIKLQQCLFNESRKASAQSIQVEIVLNQSKENQVSIILKQKISLNNPQGNQKDQKDISFSQIACGWGHLLCLDKEGNIFCCGINLHGQLGTGDRNERRKLTKIHLPKSLSEAGVKQIDCGGHFSAILTSRYQFV